MKMGAWLKEEY